MLVYKCNLDIAIAIAKLLLYLVQVAGYKCCSVNDSVLIAIEASVKHVRT